MFVDSEGIVGLCIAGAFIFEMSVTREKLEEIFKVYEDKKSSNSSTIRTA